MISEFMKELQKGWDEDQKKNPQYAERYKIVRDQLLYGKAFFTEDKDGNVKHIPYKKVVTNKH